MQFVSILYFAIAAIFIVVGILIFRGNTDLIHDYHQKNVKDFDGYGKGMGKGIISIGVFFLTGAVITLAVKGESGTIAGIVVALSGFVLSLIYILKVQKKYNGASSSMQTKFASKTHTKFICFLA